MDGEMNMQNHGYSTKCQNGGSGDWCSIVDDNCSCHGLVPSSFKDVVRTARCGRQKHHRRWSDNPKGQSKFCKWSTYLKNLSLQDHDWCFTVDGGVRRSLTARCQHQKHRRRWPGYPNYREGLQDLCLWDRIKPLELHFLDAGCCHVDVIGQRFFFSLGFVLTYEK